MPALASPWSPERAAPLRWVQVGGRVGAWVAAFLAFMLFAFSAPAVRGAVLELQSSTGQARLWEDKLPAREVPAKEALSASARPFPVVLPRGQEARAASPAWRVALPGHERALAPRGPPSGARAPPCA